MSGTGVEPPYGIAWAGRGLRIVRQIEEKLTASGWAGKDISGSRWVYRVRAFDEAANDMVVDEVVTKSATDSATGWLNHYLALGLTTYPVLRWELVEVDTSNNDSSTPTGDPEVVLETWYQDVKAKPSTT